MTNFRNRFDSTIRKQKFVQLPGSFRKVIETNNFQYFTVGNINNHIACLPVRVAHLKDLVQNSSNGAEIPFFSNLEELSLFMQTAAEIRITKKGTLNVPLKILHKAGISADIIIVGIISHIEIWDKQTFTDDVSGNAPELEDILHTLNLAS